MRADFLINGLFRFTQPNQLNDPFEVNPQILIESYAVEDRKVAKTKALEAGFPKEQLDRWSALFLNTVPRQRMTKEEFPALSYPAGINSLQELDARNATEQLKALLDHINDAYGFFCLTTARQNLLMWTFYAENHRGIVIGFS